MKKIYAVALTLCILFCCTLTGCSGSLYYESEWECCYSTIENEVYKDNLPYKLSLYTRTGSLLFFDCMQYRIEIYESAELDEPYMTYTSQWLTGASGVDLKHTIVKDSQMEGLYDKYMAAIAAEKSVAVLTDMRAEIKKDSLDNAVTNRTEQLSKDAISSLKDSCSEYSGNMAEDVYYSTLANLSGSYLDSTTQYIDDITAGLFGQSDNLNLYTTKTIDFLDDLGVYVDESDIDLTFGIAGNTMSILNKLQEITLLALMSEKSTSDATLASFHSTCEDRRSELITFVLENGQ